MRDVTQGALPVEAGGGQAADRLDARRGERLEVGVRLEHRHLRRGSGAALLGGLEIGLALIDAVGGEDVAGEGGHTQRQHTEHHVGTDALDRLRARDAHRLGSGAAQVGREEVDGSHT